jgi:hypothetical protein
VIEKVQEGSRWALTRSSRGAARGAAGVVSGYKRMGTHKRIVLIGAFPIPVGHVVEITWFRIETAATGLLGKHKTKVESLHSPQVRDLTTGIRYAVHAQFSDGVGFKPGSINLQRHEDRPGLVVDQRAAGSVVSCSIVDLRWDARGSSQIETELVIDVP